MPTTTKMGIVYPASTDLVKDGATAMGTISTTVDNKTGLVLLNTTSFSAVASQSINDVFSSSFDNYVIILSDLLSSTGTPDLLMRMRVSSADNSSAQYSINYIARSDTALVSGQTLNATSWNLGTLGTADRSYFEFKMSNPFKAQTTNMITQNVTRSSNSTAQVASVAGLAHAVSTSYTGFTIYPSANNFSGVVSVYGVNK